MRVMNIFNWTRVIINIIAKHFSYVSVYLLNIYYSNVFHRPTKYRTWTLSDLEIACSAIRDGISIRQVAEEYQIPKSMLQDPMSGKVMSGSKSGQKVFERHWRRKVGILYFGNSKDCIPTNKKKSFVISSNLS